MMSGTTLGRSKKSRRKNRKKEEKKQLDSFLDNMLGEKCVFHLRNGKMVVGRIMSAAKYELLVVTDYGRQVVLLKHAIDYVEWLPRGVEEEKKEKS